MIEELKKNKIGIIGCGRIVEERHAPALKQLGESIEVVAIADTSEKRREIIGENFPGCRKYDDYHDLLADEAVDLVDIALPQFLHTRAVIDAANAGKNVLCEKPLTTCIGDYNLVKEAVAANKIQLCVMHSYIYEPKVKKMIEYVDKGIIGDVFLVRIEAIGGAYYEGAKEFSPDWRTKKAKAGGGCLMDNGYHHVYSACRLMNSGVKSVYASLKTFTQPIEVDDTALVTLEHENGGITSIQTGWSVKAVGQIVYEAHGSKGSVCLDRDGKAVAVFENKTKTWTYAEPEGNAFAEIIQQCVKALVENSKMPAGIEVAGDTLKIVLAAYESSKQNKNINLNEME